MKCNFIQFLHKLKYTKKHNILIIEYSKEQLYYHIPYYYDSLLVSKVREININQCRDFIARDRAAIKIALYYLTTQIL